jgi:hypothetical protein
LWLQLRNGLSRRVGHTLGYHFYNEEATGQRRTEAKALTRRKGGMENFVEAKGNIIFLAPSRASSRLPVQH